MTTVGTDISDRSITRTDVREIERTDTERPDRRAELRADVDATPDAATEPVADRIVGDVDTLQPAIDTAAPATEVPSTEPTPENRARANAFSDELAAIDAREADLQIAADAAAEGDYRTPTNMRHDVLGRIAEHAQGIDDPAERDRFVRAVAPDAGLAAGKLTNSGPEAAFRRLDAIGQGVSADTGRLLVNGALQYGPANDNLVPMGRSGSPVGDALVEERQGRTRRLGELAAGTARLVIPGADAVANLVEGDVEGAIASAGVDLAGGAILRGGRYAIAAVAGGAAMMPEDAQAGVLSRLTMRFGDEAVEIEARVGTIGRSRVPTFDVRVPGTFRDGTAGSLQLVDPRGKHNALRGAIPDGNLSRTARDVSRGRVPELGLARSNGQFSATYNTVEGQATLARLVMDRVTPAELARVRQAGGRLDVPLDRIIGLTPTRGGQVVPASSVRVMSNGDGTFHLVPMP